MRRLLLVLLEIHWGQFYYLTLTIYNGRPTMKYDIVAYPGKVTPLTTERTDRFSFYDKAWFDTLQAPVHMRRDDPEIRPVGRKRTVKGDIAVAYAKRHLDKRVGEISRLMHADHPGLFASPDAARGVLRRYFHQLKKTHRTDDHHGTKTNGHSQPR